MFYCELSLVAFYKKLHDMYNVIVKKYYSIVTIKVAGANIKIC